MPSVPITEQEFKKLLQETTREKNKFIAKRDSLLYKLMYYMGLRPSEARLIRIQEIDFRTKNLFIPAQNNKEKHEDNFPIPAFLLHEIRYYIKEYYLKIWLFPSKNRPLAPVCYKAMQQAFRKRTINRLSFIDKQGRPRYSLNLYSFRKSYGTRTYKKFHDPKITANLLRHYDRQLKSVWCYVFYSEKEERKSLMKKLYA